LIFSDFFWLQPGGMDPDGSGSNWTRANEWMEKGWKGPVTKKEKRAMGREEGRKFQVAKGYKQRRW
jgi:hypothetical protein